MEGYNASQTTTSGSSEGGVLAGVGVSTTTDAQADRPADRRMGGRRPSVRRTRKERSSTHKEDDPDSNGPCVEPRALNRCISFSAALFNFAGQIFVAPIA